MISARAHISLHDVSAFEFRCIGIARPEALARTRGTQRYPVTLTHTTTTPTHPPTVPLTLYSHYYHTHPPTNCTPHSVLTLLPHPPTHLHTYTPQCNHTPYTHHTHTQLIPNHTLSLTTHHTPYPPHSPTSHPTTTQMHHTPPHHTPPHHPHAPHLSKVKV